MRLFGNRPRWCEYLTNPESIKGLIHIGLLVMHSISDGASGNVRDSTLIGQVYLVGGAIRDRLLGLPVSDRDWVVVGGSPAQLLQAGFRQADAVFPVFLHPVSLEEYALARRESNTAAGYRGFAVVCSPTISLEDDLIRRDLTINALAEDADGRLVDLFHGQRDLQARCLRHISPAFADDPVRLLRVARFAAKLGHLEFVVAQDTLDLMRQMVDSLAAVQPVRVWHEMLKALFYPQPWRFFEVLSDCGAWSAGLLTGTLDQQAIVSVPSVALAALRRVCAVTDDPVVRFATFWLQCPAPAALAAVLPKRYRVLLAQVQAAWPCLLSLSTGSVEAAQTFLHDLQAWHPQGRYVAVRQVLMAQGVQLDVLDRLEHARAAAADVHADKLRAEGLSGAAIGQAIQAARCAKIATVW